MDQRRKAMRTPVENLVISADKAIWKAADRRPFFGFVVEWRERHYARRQSRLLCEIYRRLQSGNPGLTKEALYERVVAEKLQCSPAEARHVVRGADQSFARYPEERDVTFRDVANYVITHQLMAAHDKSLGTRADMVQLFTDEIPDSL